jgi:hypothetical protein
MIFSTNQDLISAIESELRMHKSSSYKTENSSSVYIRFKVLMSVTMKITVRECHIPYSSDHYEHLARNYSLHFHSTLKLSVFEDSETMAHQTVSLVERPLWRRLAKR